MSTMDKLKMTGETKKFQFSYFTSNLKININFLDLDYAVMRRKESKQILKNISGTFNAGNLNVVLGPSGSGKTTLLNALAGIGTETWSGNILVNGKNINKNEFQNISRYITQECHIQPLLKVKEVITIAAHLKLASNHLHSIKQFIVEELIQLLNLSAVRSSFVGSLSGGERKRLSIALELIDNPGVLFVDEPTSGLDEVSSSQCVDLLKQIANSGRNVICSIHAPSAKLFRNFDHVYFISSGKCVYQGSPVELVPYLSHFQLECPVYCNPADFMMDICSEDDHQVKDQMIAVIENGKKTFVNNSFDTLESVLEFPEFSQIENKSKISSWAQFKILLLRMWLLDWRDKKRFSLKILSGALLGTLIGLVFLQIGQDTSKIQFSFWLYYLWATVCMVIPIMERVIYFPIEMKFLKREFFNNWYDLKPFFFALVVSSFLCQLLFDSVFFTLVYVLSGQPLEFARMLGVFILCFLTSRISEGYALMVSSQMNMQNSLFCGILLLSPFIIISTLGFGENFDDLSFITKCIMRINYLRYTLEGMANVTMGNRKLECSEDVEFCLYKNLDYFIKKMSMNKIPVWVNFFVLCIVFVCLYTLLYFILKQRLMPNRVFRKIRSYLKQIK